MKKAFGVAIAVFILIFLLNYKKEANKNNIDALISSGTAARGSTTQAATPEITAVTEIKKPENWRYENETDKMGRNIRWAYTISVNTVSFDFPYDGAQHGTLNLRTRQSRKDAILSIKKGQFLLGVDGCKVLVRFDEKKPQTYWAVGSADLSTTDIFLSDYSRFMAGLKHAKKVFIEAPFYQEGNKIFEFNVEGLKWEIASSKKKKATENNESDSATE